MEDQNPVVETTAEVSAVSGIFQVFSSPGSFFSSLKNKQAWLIPFVLTLIVAAVLGHFTRPLIIKDLAPQIRANLEKYKAQMPSERFNAAMADIDKMEQEAEENAFQIKYILIAAIFIVIGYFFIAFIGWLSGNFMFGGKANFWLIMNVVAFASLIGLSGDIIRGVMMLAKDSSAVYTGLGMLKPVNDGSFVYYLFRQIDLFSIWRIIVTAIGLGALYKMTSRNFAIILFVLWLIFAALVAGANIFTGGSIMY